VDIPSLFDFPYFFALLIGFTVGFFGGGGSILSVPVLVYACSVEPILATAYSLFIVGVSALAGAFDYGIKKLIEFKVGVIFAIPSIIAVYLTRRFLIPALPDRLFEFIGNGIQKDNAILILFSIVMIIAALSMMFAKRQDPDFYKKLNIPLVVLEGAGVGVLTGIVGAGGGFLIVPGLVLLTGMPIKKAIGTTLFIISLKSLLGFVGDLQTQAFIDWPFLLKFTLISTIGIFIGSNISRRAKAANLKKGFAGFILIMGIIMLLKEIFLSEL